MKLTIVMYHYTRDLTHSRYPAIKGLDAELFREQIAFLKEHFTVVTMEEVLDCLEGRYELPEHALLLTFDDGYIDNYTLALPVLEENRLQGSFFIPGKTFAEHKLLDVNKLHYTLAAAEPEILYRELLAKLDYYRGREFDFPSNEELIAQYAVPNRFDTGETIFVKRMLQTVLPERLRKRISSALFAEYVNVSEEQLAYELYMSEEQIRLMKRHGMFIGVHGYDHYWLGNLPDDQMREDIQRALTVMDEFIDRKRWVMNYPYGSYNDGVLKYVGSEGAAAGLITKVAVADLDTCAPLELPRLDCNDFPPKSENYKNISRSEG